MTVNPQYFAIAIVLTAFVAGCASTELRAFRAARDEYEACLAEYPNEPNRCSVLKDAANRRYTDYEAAAKARWGGRGSWRDPEDPWD